MSSKDLPWDRLATTDQTGRRIYLYPSEVRGRWKDRRSKLSIGLILLFLGLPWVRVGGHQSILLDVPNRNFSILGLTFWAHDAPLLFFIFGGSVILIAFITAIWGRVWCGWACPQTVFVEQVYRRVEYWIEGDALTRRRMDEGPLNLNKVKRKAMKWAIFSTTSLVLSHSFLAYFIGTEELGRMMARSPFQNPVPFLIMAGIAGLILFDFGWFREQFCTVVCPYGRFQSVLMDDHSSVIAYDSKRGEPRKGTAAEGVPTGDCVNCYRCVQVCPTGIDIRRGVQLECVACTSCIDACDDVMGRLKKPLGLIRYGNQAMADGKEQTSTPWFKRTRAWIYLIVLVSCISGLTYTIIHRSPIELTLIRAVDFPYQEIQSEGIPKVINHFKVDLRNQTFENQEILFNLSSAYRDQGFTLIVSNHKSSLAAGESERADLFLQFPRNSLTMGRGRISIQVEAISKGTPANSFSVEAYLVGPLR